MGSGFGNCRSSAAERLAHNARKQNLRFLELDPRPGLPALGFSNRKEARVPFTLWASEYGWRRLPGLNRRAAESPPTFRVSDYFQFQLHQGVLHP